MGHEIPSTTAIVRGEKLLVNSYLLEKNSVLISLQKLD